MFFWPLVGAVALDGLALFVATRDIAPSLVLVSFMGVRLLFLTLFTAVFYCQRRMSLLFPLMWELGNMMLIVAKGCTFLMYGAPFKDAWVLLGLCAASIVLELVCVAHLRSSAGKLPRQHVFLHSAIGAMATMNLVKNPSYASISPTNHQERGMTEGFALAVGDDFAAYACCLQGDDNGAGEGGGLFLEDQESGEYATHHRQSSFDEQRRFLSDWNTKVDELRVTWRSKVDELAERLVAARRNRGWGGAEGGGAGGGAAGDGEGAPLLLLARLFAQEQAAIEELEDLWNRDPKWTEFFLPQYTLFLLYASFAHSSRLQKLLLDRCESSVLTAHTIYWFLTSFCLRGARVDPVGVKAIEQMLREVVSRGERPAKAFCELGWGDGDEAKRYMELFDERSLHEGNGNGGGRSFGGRFLESTAFVDELVKISVVLAGVAKEDRTEELRRRLREVQAQFLPSSAIYLPLCRRRHRVYRIAVEESFSFSTKDRAPYLVTMEVLDFRQQRPSPSLETERGRSASSRPHRGVDVGPVGATGNRGGGVRGGLIRMLTPRSLGQSLRDMADSTLTTLKRGVSAKSGRGGGTGSNEPDDVESRPPLIVSLAGDVDVPSREPMAAPARSGGDVESVAAFDVVLNADSASDHSPSFFHVPLDRRKERDVKDGAVDGEDALTAATFSHSSGSADPLTALSDTAVHAAAAAVDGNSNTVSSNSNIPPSPTEAGSDAIDWSIVPPPASEEAGAAVLFAVGSGTETETGAFPQQAGVAVATGNVGREGDWLLSRGDGEGKGSRVQGKGGSSNAIGGGGGGRGTGFGAVNGGSYGKGRDQSGEEKREVDIAQRLVPPSFSSTNLMGMWSRPSKPMAEAGQAAFSPTSPRRFYSNGSPISINGTTAGAAATPVTTASGADSPGAPQLTAGPAGSVPVDGGEGNVATSREGGPGRIGSPRKLTEAATPSLAECVTPPRPMRDPSATLAGGTPVAPSPGNFSANFSVDGAGEGVQALLLSRENNTPGSAHREGYGTTLAAAPTPASTEGGRTPSPSPIRSSKRKPSGYGYMEVRSQQQHGWRFPAGVGRFSVGEGRGGGGLYEEDDEEEEEDEDRDGDGEAGSAPPTVIFKERWHQKEARLKRASKLGQAREWRLMPVIVKAGDDLRQEQLASQFFALAHRILKQSPLRARAGLRPYGIVATSHDAGIIEAIPDTVSIDALKKNDPLYTTLSDFFHRRFGPADSEGFQRARRHFVESLAANSIVTYLLQIKDRHNGNILLDARGRVIHIDFGFMLANSPGGNLNFESAPFKLTAEFVDLMGGPTSACFRGFRELCVQTFMELRRKMPRLILLLETSSVGNAHLPCFGGRPEAVVGELRARFKPDAHDRAAMAHVHALIDTSMGCWRTSWYDLYQSFAVGIAK